MQIKLLLQKRTVTKQYIVKAIFALLFCIPFVSFAQLIGVNMSNPIVMGTYSGGTVTYADTKNNNTANGYLNDYGQLSDDIYYKFTIQGSAQVQISHCSSAFDTYVHLLNSDGSLNASNDDNGPLCAGTTASLSVTLPAGSYYIVSEGYGSNSGNITTSVTLTVQAPPVIIYNTRNFIRNWDVVKPITDANTLSTSVTLQEARMSTTYFDGLGRDEQAVIKQGSLSLSGNFDVVRPVVYDQYGRETLKYLPYVATTSDGIYKDNPVTAQASFYNGTTSPISGQGEIYFYSKTDFESSPLNRVTKTLAPGNSWVGSNRGIEQKYWTNTAVDDVKIWNVSNSTTLGNFGSYSISPGPYSAGELLKNATIDEHGKQVIEFKDKEGKIILKKVQFTSASDDGIAGKDYTGWLCTYYIYDDLNRLRAVLQPKAVEELAKPAVNWQLTTDVLNELTFRYEYDERGRMINKKVPGAGEVWMIYDARDRLVMTQDANLRAEGKWVYTEYDALNRPFAGGFTFESHDLAYHLNLAKTTSPYPNLGYWGYGLLWHTLYDDYSWTNNYPPPVSTNRNTDYDSYFNLPSNTYPQPLTQSFSTKGLVTATRTLNMSTGIMMWTLLYYDEKGRIIQNQSTNATGGIDVLTTQYNFIGQALQTVLRHQKNGTNPQTTLLLTTMTYDDLGRVTQINKKVSNSLVNSGNLPAGWTNIVNNEYDALGQLKKKTVGNKPGLPPGTPLANLNYDYNIRGWLLSVNKNYITASSNNDEYFGMELGYDKNGAMGTFSPQFNGNISGTIWKSEGDQQKRKYDFSYDPVNRLTAAPFTQYVSGSGTTATFNVTAGLNFSVENLSYDANGNIKSMRQLGYKGTSNMAIDDFTYNYKNSEASNKLLAVTESTGIATTDHKLGDFTDKNRTLDDYDYDPNGNLIYDKNKNITSITYTHLNLPEVITITGKGTINYRYDGLGNKLKKWVTDTSIPGKTITTTTTYMGSMVYESRTTVPANTPNDDYIDRLLFITHEEGRIRFEPATAATCAPQPERLIYDYFIKDHLGNTRMLLTEQKDPICYPAATVEDARINNEKHTSK